MTAVLFARNGALHLVRTTPVRGPRPGKVARALCGRTGRVSDVLKLARVGACPECRLIHDIVLMRAT